ncbi:hypothetical protein [Cysteiniphilum sp. QT6929]|uniref:hypothetical protein n=1 Tax=Cysteiniphilum sp. QT6929 TaxID=2975055 RepID=UPI0024B39447|nr:hypothetical protein [Cysteiniphilum sp. QT6929]WHN65787.1 hypothetical protein NYP54_00785 [Cysteiniphilum sp. QT6929]
MNIQNHVFLSGWGFKASLWQIFHPEISTHQCIDMPPFSSFDFFDSSNSFESVGKKNEEQVLQYLLRKLAKAEAIHAWSHSGLWVLRLIQQNKLDVKNKNIYCYGLPLLWQFASDEKKQAFIRQYESNPKRLSQKFLKLVAFPEVDRLKLIESYCLLADAGEHYGQLNYLKWMFAFTEIMPITDAIALCEKTGVTVFLAENDAIVDSLSLVKLLNSELTKNLSHLGLLDLAVHEVSAC